MNYRLQVFMNSDEKESIGSVVIKYVPVILTQWLMTVVNDHLATVERSVT